MGEADPSLNIEELLVASAFPHDVTELRLVETHISWVILTGTLAYKIKKPIQLDFIDTSTLERRRHHCEEELRLNRRLAPELYLRVVPITRVSGRARIEGAGEPVEYAVCLKQFPSDAELPALLQHDQVSLPEMIRLGEVLADFHMHTPALSGRDAPDTTQRTYDRVLANLEQLFEFTGQPRMTPELRRLWDWTREAIDAHEATFEERVRDHRIRDCHGDLHAANIVRFEGRLVPFDGIDFDPQLRFIDVIDDIAFLIMDLHGHRRDDLAAALLSRYLEITGDYAGVRLLPFYAVYRALVRAKVDAIAAERSPHLAGDYTDRMHRRVSTAVGLTRRPKPLLLLMHGVSGSGKSWLSAQLIAPLHAIRVRSDLERQRLLRTSPTTTGFKQGNYAPEMSHRVYARLIDCAESCLQAGFNVIVDASFLDASDRELFVSLADRMLVRCMFISCSADPAMLMERVATRAEQGGDPSQADQSVVRAQLRELAPLETQPVRVITVDTRDADAVEKVMHVVLSQSRSTACALTANHQADERSS